MNARLQIRTLIGGLLLAAFGFCMMQLLHDNGLLEEMAIAKLIPELVTSTASTPAGEAPDSGFLPELPPPPPPEKHIVVDAGHGGRDGGTQGHGLLEKEWALLIARALAADLKARGFKVKMTRDGDDSLDLAERIKLANAKPNHLFVSVHLNWSAEPSVSGIETFFSPGRVLGAEKEVRQELEVPRGASLEDTRSMLLAEAVQKYVSGVTSANDRGTKDGSHLFVLRHSVAPAILIECGFLSNEREADLILKSSYRERLASGIADGITRFLNSVEDDALYGLVITPELPDLPDIPEIGIANEGLVTAQ